MNQQRFVLWSCAGLLAAWQPLVAAYDIVVDNDGGAPGYVETGQPWELSGSPGYNGGTYRFLLDDDPPGTATWTPDIPESGPCEVFAILRTSTNRAFNAPYSITHANGVSPVFASQNGPNQISEVFLGEFDFDAGTTGSVSLSNSTEAGAYIADAIRFRTAVDDPPTIGPVVRGIEYPDADEPVPVTATVSDDRGVAEVTLHYSASPSGASGSSPMTGGGPYSAIIPGMPDGDTVSYHVSARDTGDNTAASLAEEYVSGAGHPGEYRAIWIDSWNSSFLNPAQAENLVATCRANNINTIIPEIRKIGDAYYDSSIEPRATNISGGSGYDPLQYLIDLCHDTSGGKEYIHVHAWFVMHRIAKSETLSPMHVLSQHPEYEMLDSTGSIGVGNRYLDPGHPGTAEHNIAVILDCLSKYDIDGVNLDYIRYPETAGSWGYNPTSVARFNAFTGGVGQPSSGNSQWAAWRRRMVTQEVRKLYVKMKEMKRHVVLTADTVNWGFSWDDFSASAAYSGVFQDWKGWLEEGILDYNAIMNYSNQNQYPTRYQGWTDLTLASDDARGSIIGIGAYLQDEIEDSMWQLLYAREKGAAGLNIYDWGSETSGDDSGASRADFFEALRTEVFTEWVDPPDSPWLSNPTKAIVQGTVTCGGSPVDHALVTLEGTGRSVYSDATGWFGFVDVEPGTMTVRIAIPGEEDTLRAVTASAGDIMKISGVCKTSEVGDIWAVTGPVSETKYNSPGAP